MKAKIELRKFPYPFQAALSICSDIDHTHLAEKFLKIQEFMNREIGLAFTNTFFPFHEQDEFSLFSSRPQDRAVLLEHLRNGNIEALHGFGEKKNFTREDARKMLAELKKNDIHLKMWVDHADFPGNFCKYRCPGRGDQPGQKEYHLDLTADYGIRYIWTDRLTTIIGQGASVTWRSLFGVFDFKHPAASGLNALKTGLKVFLGFFKSKKYSFMSANEPVQITTLQDGKKMFEFIRFNNYFQGAARGDSFSELYYLISQKVLKNLISRKAYSVVYVHLGKCFDLESAQNQRTLQALRELKAAADQGKIWVDSTLRHLEYYIGQRYLNWDYSVVRDEGCITIHSIDDPVRGPYVPKPEELRHLTFYVPENVKIKVKINRHEVVPVVKNELDYSGKPSISIQ
jgi:hypothetical protein